MDKGTRAIILIVDDIQINRALLRDVFADLYDVEEAANGRIALEMMRKKNASVVLLDVAMPEMDGFSMLSAIRNNAAFSDVPVLVITDGEAEDQQLRALELGATDVVSRPVNLRMIQARVRNIIENRCRQELASKNNMLRMQIQQQEQKIVLSETDSLTGVYTRDTFCRKAAEMIVSQPVGYYSVVCFDVDGFKVINDQYGMLVGNHVLQYLAECMKGIASGCQGLVGRMFADNFCMLYPAESGLERISSPDGMMGIFQQDGYHFTLQLSAGYYLVIDRSLPVDAMLDRALLAKNTVKGRYDVHVARYASTMRENVMQEQWIIREMEKALRNKQFEVWFQPQYDHASGLMVGAEALVRWRHPEKGLIFPGQFIPIFERNGFIYALDKYIWECTCQHLRRWLELGLTPPPVSVNVSRYDIFRTDFFDTITGYLKEYRIPLDMFQLEITESAFATSTEQIIVIVQRLMDFGLTVEIDDFGSGYSSLNTLKDVPANVLKIDMQFFQHSGISSRGGSILEAVVRMAKWLNMVVIAEGVEHKEQADFLRSVGCRYIQGYFYAKPMPVEAYERRLGIKTETMWQKSLAALNKLNTEAFWDPSSIDTLVFNYYAGGACVFEYWNGKLEMLRANGRFAAAFNAKLIPEDMLKDDLSVNLDATSKRRLMAAIEHAIQSGEAETFEVKRVSEDSACEYIRLTLQMVTHADERFLFYCYAENVTAQRLAEQVLEESERQLRFLNGASRDLLTALDSSQAIKNSLTKIMNNFKGVRAYILEFGGNSQTVGNTYEVCEAGVTLQKDNLQNVPMDVCQFWRKAFEKDNHIVVEEPDKLGIGRIDERRVLDIRGARSIVAVPLRRENQLIGIMGVDNPQQNLSSIKHLEALGDYMAVMLTRRDFNAKLKKDNEALLHLMNDTPGGFARMRVWPDGDVKMVFANDGMGRLLSMKHEEMRQLLEENVFVRAHPDDAAMIRESLKQLLETMETSSLNYRLLTAENKYVLVNVFARANVNDQNELYLNVYYSSAIDAKA